MIILVQNRALKFGTATHTATELWDKGILDLKSLSKPLIPYLEGWKKFKKDMAFEIEAVEERVYSDKYHYRGTLDRRGIIAGKRCVVDIKTSVDFHAGTSLQLAAYQGAYNEGKALKDQIKDRYAVILNDEGTYKIMKYIDASDYSVFLCALSLTNWKEKHI